MSIKVKYGYTEPTEKDIDKEHNRYVDLTTDYMYMLVEKQWVLITKNGFPVEQDNF